MMDLGFCYWCRTCDHAVNWQGEYTDPLPCPKCGDRPDTSELEWLQKIHEWLAEREGTEDAEVGP
jgi:hypothetical protein